MNNLIKALESFLELVKDSIDYADEMERRQGGEREESMSPTTSGDDVTLSLNPVVLREIQNEVKGMLREAGVPL